MIQFGRNRVRVLAALAVLALGVTPATACAGFLVSSINTGQVLAYDSTTGAFNGVFVGAGSGGLSAPYELVFGPNGNLYVGAPGVGVLEFNGTTGAFIANLVPAGTAGLNYPYGLTFGPNGNLFVASRGSGPNQFGQILEFDGTTGVPIGNGVFVQGSSDGLHDPTDLTFGPNGNLFVVDSQTANVLEYNGTTGAFVTTFVTAGSGGLNTALGLTFGPNGNLFVTNNASGASFTGQVLEYNGTTGAFVTDFVSAGSGGLNGPAGLVFGPNGNLFVTSYDGRTGGGVLEYDGTTGTFVRDFVTGGSGGLNDPLGVAFSPAVVVPEPPSWGLLGSGGALCLAGYVWQRHRRRLPAPA
jgi:streptogramin lyase